MWILSDRDFTPRVPRQPRQLPQVAASLLLYVWLFVALPFALLFAILEIIGTRSGRLLTAMAGITTILRRAARRRAIRTKKVVSAL